MTAAQRRWPSSETGYTEVEKAKNEYSFFSQADKTVPRQNHPMDAGIGEEAMNVVQFVTQQMGSPLGEGTVSRSLSAYDPTVRRLTIIIIIIIIII